MSKFKLRTPFAPKGDQPEAIQKLSEGILAGKRSQVLLGITGSGKTFTVANIIQKVQKPILVLAHNKTLAAQLYQEFKEFFPDNAVEYFVSYYDYYQPEAYLPRTDTYIEKDLAINEEIEKMRLSATRSLIERSDVIVVSSVSCIYGLGLPDYYEQMRLTLQVGHNYDQRELLLQLVQMHYKRTTVDFYRGLFRVRGEVLEICPAYEQDVAYRIEFFDDRIERISKIDPLNFQLLDRLDQITLYPASHYVTPKAVRERAIELIKLELQERADFFESEGKLIEKERILQRTAYDIEMIREIGFCKGIENYSRAFSERKAGEPSPCLLDYFPSDFLLFVDESHQTMPQIRAMYHGDRSRKEALVEFGFRLPSAFDNRPLRFEEFYNHIHQVVYLSATPNQWEIHEAGGEVVEQIIRPTGLLDPIIEVRRAEGQVDDVLEEIRVHAGRKERILVTTLTKKLSEDLTGYLLELGVKAKYLHSEVHTLERVQILRELRQGVFDVLVGINLLREGLDLPEVSLVAILDADKEGFLRSETALIQTCGRAARNAQGKVIMYADKMTDSIKRTLSVTERRRALQMKYNEEHGVVPKTIYRSLGVEMGGIGSEELDKLLPKGKGLEKQHLTRSDIEKKIKEYERAMKLAAKEFRFEDAVKFRDLLHQYQKLELELG